MTAAASEAEGRVRRAAMRCWRRGTREMDLILGPFADAELPRLGDGELSALEALLEENDQDLYAWITGRDPAPAQHGPILDRVRRFHEIC